MRIWRGEPGRRIAIGSLGLIAVTFGGVVAGNSAVGEVNPIYRGYQVDHRQSSTPNVIAPSNSSAEPAAVGGSYAFYASELPFAADSSLGRDDTLDADYLRWQKDLEHNLYADVIDEAPAGLPPHVPELIASEQPQQVVEEQRTETSGNATALPSDDDALSGKGSVADLVAVSEFEQER